MMTKLKCFMQSSAQPGCASTALLLVRLIAGAAFLHHGWGKIQNPFGWMGAQAPVPGIFQFLAALSEFGGGIALILGFLTKFFSLGLAFTMLVAVYTHMMVIGDPFVSNKGGGSYELAAVYFSIAVLMILVGPGKYSVDSKVFGNRS
jgi:putative oxidoreductase